jgi:predicted ATPase
MAHELSRAAAEVREGVLRTAIGLEGGGRPDPLRVGSATSAALAEVADDGPVLIAVDDANWVDRPTLDALAFMLRRNQPLDVRSILTRRTVPVTERPSPLPR